MIVCYARERGYQGDDVDPSFTLEKEYLALGVLFFPDGRPALVTLQRDSDAIPVVIELRYLDVIDPVIPADWCLFELGDGRYGVRPKEFGGDFWDRYHDGEPHAGKLFEQVVDKLKAFHNI
ncbi:hypothetical protein [Cupriavidus sp. M-11]|uniref:hypothetical protein n=1 Tax=Cupriavidus sp. M-11 TaxID=3233038 RepID=UPI003F8F6EA9